MKEFTAACVQIAISPNRVEENIAKCIDWLGKAVSEYQADLVVFPEGLSCVWDIKKNVRKHYKFA